MTPSTSPLDEPLKKPTIVNLLIKTITTSIVGLIGLLFWPIYLLMRIIWYRPPNVVNGAQVVRYLRLAWTAQPPPPGLSWQARVWLTLSTLRKFFLSPIMGVAWLLDEAIYGRKLNQIRIIEPLFVISGGRSGSTQMTRYIEEDPRVTAPSLLQSMFPFLWLWKLVPKTIGRFIPPTQVTGKLEAMMPPELLERHEFNPFKADTFDGAFFNGHLNTLALYLGPDIAAQEFNFAKFSPHDKHRHDHDFVQLVDRIGRKHHIFTGATPSTPKRLFIKGHFLCAAEALAEKYPDATFLTLVRDPAKRLQSGINYLRVNPSDGAMGPPRWDWLSQTLLRTESDYAQIEQVWYGRDDGDRRCVVRFADFVADLEGTMAHVYRVCFDENELPPHVPITHPPRERKNYKVNYTLAELGIDADELRANLADYVAWCQPALAREANA